MANSGLPYVILRLGGVMSRDMLGAPGKGGAVIGRTIPADNRIHMVDARDVALALDDDECSSALPLQYSDRSCDARLSLGGAGMVEANTRTRGD